MSPRIVPLDHHGQPEDVVSAMKVQGNTVNALIIRFLIEHKKAFMGDIAEGTGLNLSTLGFHLRELEEIRVIKSDIPAGRRRGRSVNYSVDVERIRYLSEQYLHYLISEPTGDRTPLTEYSGSQ